MSHTSTSLTEAQRTEDQRICAWYESQSEDFLADLFELYEASTPRECWDAWCAVVDACPSPANPAAPASLPAPAVAEQGEGIRVQNREAWMAIADFLILDGLRSVVSLRAANDCHVFPRVGEMHDGKVMTGAKRHLLAIEQLIANEEASGDPELVRVAAMRRRCLNIAPQDGWGCV